MIRPTFWMACAVVLIPTPSPAAGPEQVSVEEIWDRAPHNAFTDLIRWRGRWYCTFREAEAHVGGDGRIRLLESADGRRWEPVALIAEERIDLRDPKLSITSDDRLMIVAGGSVYRGTRTLMGRQPRVAFSRDGRQWTAPRRILEGGEWLWRVTWHGGKAYGVSYGTTGKDDTDWTLKLFVSGDGESYDLVTRLDVPGRPNETTLRVLPDGEMIALVRREAGDAAGWIGASRPPYTRWSWAATKHRLGGPNFLRLPDGSLWAAGRSYPGGAKTVLARMTSESYEPVLTLPSGGDTSYPGLVWHGGLLWISYYSSHEGKAAIYLAKVRLPLAAEPIGSRVEPFVDGELLDRLGGGARLQVQRPTPGEVVLTADKPWEGNTSAYVTVFRDGARHRMYYRGAHFDEKAKRAAHREVTCYAESRDGLHWVKPELGLFDFEGSSRNNIVWDGPGTHNFTPFRDANPESPAEARYKALALVPGGLMALRSPDGIHWTRMAEAPVITRGAFDSQNLAFWDPTARLYREYHRGFRDGVRDIMTGTSADFLHWTEPVYLEYSGAPREHLYTNAVQPYARAPHILVGFPTRFLPATEQTEPTFMASRDGRRLRRYPDVIIPTTAPADRSGNRCNYMAWGIIPLPGRDRELSAYATEAYYTGPGTRIRRFVYRLDGFVALHAGPEGGEAVTRPLRFTGTRMILNARTAAMGGIRVGLHDEGGEPLRGYATSECPEVRGDEVARAVSWDPGGDVRPLAGRVIRIRFVLKDADLYSFRFE